MPYHWLVREAVFGLAAGVVALWLADGERPWVMLGMVAAMYPDVEKVLFFDHGVADAFILFDWHSKYLSNRTGGLPKPVLIAFECGLIAACLFTMWRQGRGARDSRHRGFQHPPIQRGHGSCGQGGADGQAGASDRAAD